MAAAWGLLAGCFVIGFLGQALRLPHRVIELSPFQHVPELPAVGLRLTPLVTLFAVAVLLVTAGIAGFRRRDVG
jgi:ABC-2 type transport system permease protein